VEMDAGHARGGGLRYALRGLTAQLAAPQGFTLSIGGTLAATVGQRGVSDLFDVWLYVMGAGLSFCLLALMSGSALRAGPGRGVPVSRAAVLNVLPVVVVPAAVGCAALITSRPFGFLAAGALASGVYVTLLGFIAMRASRRLSRDEH
jgi:hypothetical protein